MKKKSLKPWIILSVAPIPTLIFTAMLQTLVRFLFSSPDESTTNALQMIVNIISLLLGVFSVLCLIGLPIWIIMLVLTVQHNNKIQQPPQQ